MPEKLTTKHPQSKKGVRISGEKYETVRQAVIACLHKNDLTYTELADCVGKRLSGFAGSIRWYVEVVKLDLEARRVIVRTTEKPQRYRLVKD